MSIVNKILHEAINYSVGQKIQCHGEELTVTHPGGTWEELDNAGYELKLVYLQ
jgi:hypothetical protein